MNDGNVKNPREEIDRIDGQLLSLLNERAAIALRVGVAMSTRDASLCDPKREIEVLSRLVAENSGPLDDRGIENIFQRIIDESLLLQQRMVQRPVREPAPQGDRRSSIVPGGATIGFLGERGTFSYEAALGVLGEDGETVSFPTFDDLFGAIGQGRVDYIVAPLENTLVGSLHRCYDLLLESSLHIVAEIILPVSHFLVGCPEATFETIETVESHPAALAQCQRFFAAHPHLKRVAGDDTAGSVKRAVTSGDVTRAGIGSRRAAELYSGNILREHIEDHPENFTRFALLSRAPGETNRGDKISMVLTLSHEPGSLHKALRAFFRRDIDLLKIESRPIRDTPTEFYFYLDVRAPALEGELQGALDDVREQAADMRYLGRYSTIRL